MKNPYAKRIAREYHWLFLRVMFYDLPRLRRQKLRAARRGESLKAIDAEADRIGQELKKKYQLYVSARKADKMLGRAGWQ